MLHWQIEKIFLELKYSWKISRNSSDEKTNLVVEVADGDFKGRGEAAPNIRYNESPDELIKQFEKFERVYELLKNEMKSDEPSLIKAGMNV